MPYRLHVHRSSLCVPIREGQYHHKALPFFPLPEHHLVVIEDGLDEAEEFTEGNGSREREDMQDGPEPPLKKQQMPLGR
eukprot:scaffold216697_cov34-Tisochrysis_lutea.AAC.3